MLARVVADCAASRRLFMLRIKKSSLIRFVAPPFQNANSSLVCILVFFFSRYISRYARLKFRFLLFVVASIVAMVFLRRICSSRPGDGEQRGQSLAALTARGMGLDCLQPQPQQPVLRRNKLRIFRFRASAKAQSLRLFLLSPRSRLLRGNPNYGRTLCVQTDWAA